MAAAHELGTGALIARIAGSPFAWLARKASTIAGNVRLDDPRMLRLFGSGPTHAGETVTVDSALQLSTVWACVRLIAQTCATLPLLTYLRDAKGNGTIARDHWLFSLLHDSPSADQTAVEFWECLIASLLLWGNGYAQIIWSGPRVVAMIPMRPDRVVARRLEDGSLEYRYVYGGQDLKLSEGEVFHLRGFSLDGITGLSVIGMARQTLGIATAIERATGAFFKNGMRPSLWVSAPHFLTPEQRGQRQEYIDGYTGALNAGKVPLMEGGWKLESLSVPPEDSEMLASRQFSVEEICRWYGVPPPMIGHAQAATAWGSGLEQMSLWFLTYCLRPTLKRVESRISKTLIQPADRGKTYAEFDVDGLLRADSRARAAFYVAMVDHGMMKRNEARARENLPPDPDGNELTVNAALLPLRLLGQFVRGKGDKPLDPGFNPASGTAEPGGTQAPEGTPTKEAASAGQ